MVVEIKPMQNRTFDPGGSQGHSRACPFWDRGARWFVVRRYVLERLGDELQQFLEDR